MVALGMGFEDGRDYKGVLRKVLGKTKIFFTVIVMMVSPA